MLGQVTLSQQVAPMDCPLRGTLDQQSPGSSPGGAMKPGNDLTVAGFRLFDYLA